jgi:hypothetical protein
MEVLLREEELLFSFKMVGFEDFDKAVSKLQKLDILWRNAAIFYEMRKNILVNFSDDLDIIGKIFQVKELFNTIVSNKNKCRNLEEIVVKMSKIMEDDMEVFKDFLEVTNEVIRAPGHIDENLKNKVISLLDSKKMETACKNILFLYYSKKT